MHNRLGLAFACTAFLLAGFGSGTATAATTVGIGEQHPAMFSDPLFRDLRLRHARMIVPYDVVSQPADRQAADEWLAAARANGITPLVELEHSRANPRKRPSVAEFARAFKAFRERYPYVRNIGAFNEANHQSQPTFHRPKLAARYYNAVRANCRGCRIVALDVLDQAGMVDYVKTFKRYAKKPRIWGLHNYRDTNRNRSSGTAALLSVTKGPIWMTETGGIVAFERAFPYNEQRAASALERTLALSVASKRIQRIYLYSWRGAPRGFRFDAGLVGPDGTARPGYEVVKRNVKGGKVKPAKGLKKVRLRVKRRQRGR